MDESLTELRARLSGVVMTHPSRRERAESVAQAVGGGRMSVVTDPEPDGPPTALRTTLRAWSSARAGATHHLVIHDDMQPSAGFWERARAAATAFPSAALALSVFWSSRNGAAVRLGALGGRRWVRAVNEYTPCTALILPVGVARGYVAFARQAGDFWPEDVLMYRYLRSAGIPAYIAAPSVAEHQDLRSLSGNDFHGQRRSSCFLADPGDLGPGIGDTPAGFPVVPFFKHGVAQCAVRRSGAGPERWESVPAERYLARIGFDAARVTAGLPDASPSDDASAAAVRGTWLTAYAMGVVCHRHDQLPSALSDLGDGRARELAEAALATVAPGGMCHRLSARDLVALQRDLAPMAMDAFAAGLGDAARGAGRLRRRSRCGPTVVVAGDAFPAAQLARGLADRGDHVIRVDGPDREPAGAVDGVIDLVTAPAHLMFRRPADLAPDALPGRGGAARARAETLRCADLYGPGMPLEALLPELICQALTNQPIVLDEGDETPVPLLHVDDLVGALHRSVAGGAEADRLRIVRPRRYTVRALAHMVARAVRPVPVVYADGRPAADPARSPGPPPTPGARAVEARLRFLAQWIAYESEAPLRPVTVSTLSA